MCGRPAEWDTAQYLARLYLPLTLWSSIRNNRSGFVLMRVVFDSIDLKIPAKLHGNDYVDDDM